MDVTNPTVRWGMGLASGAMIAAVALLLLEGTAQLVVLGVAVLDVVSTPWFLKQASEGA